MTASAYLDACGWIPTSGGSGNWTVSAAIQGYQTLAAAATAQGVASGSVFSYRAESNDKSQWEEGFGASGSSNTTLARSTITANSSGGTSAINFTAAPNVYITAASADLRNASLLNSGLVPTAQIAAGTAAANSVPFGDQNYNGGPWRLLATLTASNSASLGDTTHITSSYAEYEIVFENLVFASSGVSLEFQVHSGGSFQTSSYGNSTWRYDTGGSSAVGSTSCIYLTGPYTTSGGPGTSGFLRVSNPSQTSNPKMFHGLFYSYQSSSGLAVGSVAGGFWNGGNGAIDGFQVLASSGNLTSGAIKIYGRA